MSKQKLFEYCQKYKVAPPQFVTTGQGIIFSSAVVVQCLDTVDDCQTFYSRETHQSKKKSENDAAEVALETINIAVAKTLPAMDAKVAAAATLTDFLKTLLKAVNNAHPGVFENHAVIPANYLLLFTGVHSALNRIDASYRKDSSGAYLYLLTALDSSVQNFLNVHKNESGTFVSKIADDPAIRAPWRSFRTQKLESVQSSIRFVLIPAASDMLPYEINADFQIEHSENDSENENETEDEISKKIGLKIVQALYVVQKALKIPGETTFTTPLFTPSVSDHLYGLSQLFNGDHIENNVVIKNDDTIIDRNLSDIRNHVRTDNGDDNATCKEMELSTGSGNLPPTSVHMKDSSPYVRSKSVWLPRLLIHHRRSAGRFYQNNSHVHSYRLVLMFSDCPIIYSKLVYLSSNHFLIHPILFDFICFTPQTISLVECKNSARNKCRFAFYIFTVTIINLF